MEMMELSEKDIDIIDKHLAGQLSKDEDIYFNFRMSDGIFTDEVLLKKDLFNAYQSMEFDAQKIKLKQLEVNLKPSKPSRSGSLGWALIGIMLMISLALLYFINRGQNETDLLYASYYKPYPNVVSPIQRSTGVEYDVFQLYELGRYDEALVGYEDPISENEEFYKALTMMASNQFENCKTIFENIITVESKYAKAAEWYLALTYLKLEDKTNCINILQKIEVEKTHPYQRNAAILRRKI